jgi:hypothetical protein
MTADWAAVLARIETALSAAIAQIEAREQALAAPTPAAEAAALDFRAVEQPVTGLSAAPGRAAASVNGLDGELAGGEEALRQWLARSEATRRQLAAWVGRAVG